MKDGKYWHTHRGRISTELCAKLLQGPDEGDEGLKFGKLGAKANGSESVARAPANRLFSDHANNFNLAVEMSMDYSNS